MKVTCSRTVNAFQSNAHHVSYLAKSEVDNKGVHHVAGSGWRRVSAIMDSGSAECVAPENIARNIPLMETEASRQGQTYHTADGGVIKNKGEKTVMMYSEDGDQFRARYQITDVTRPLNSISRVCDQGNNVLFTKTGGWIINHESGRYTWFPREHGVYVLQSWVNESFSQAGVLGFCDPEGHVEPAVSVRPRMKTQASNSSSNICPVVEEEMDDDVMDDKEEPSEESRPVRGGHRRVVLPTAKERQEHERTHLPYRSWCRHCVSARASNPAHRGRKFPIAVEEDMDTKQVSYDYCFMRDKPGMESAKILVSKDRATRMFAHVVPLKGAVIDWVIQQCARDLERNSEILPGSCNCGRAERNC